MHIYDLDNYILNNFEMNKKGRTKMKNLLAFSAVAIAVALSTNVQAQSKENEKWVAGFIEDYSTDHAETGLPDFLDNGVGLGVEFGMRFTPDWAVRVEASNLDIDASPTDHSGNRVGVDVLYFLPDDLLYAFGGLKNTEIVDGDAMVNLGLGKHWDLSDSVKIITEVAAYQPLDSNNSNTHIGLKLGLAYAFGGSTTPAAPTDGDNDGVFDSKDQCLNTPAGTPVDSMGCNLDLDADGVINRLDNCPNTPAGTQVDSYGCNNDVDADGILNTIDKCPDTPAGTKVGAKGCSLILDTDQDGVLDNVDQCAGTPMSDKVDVSGCSVFVDEEVSTNVKVLFGNNSSIIDNPNDAQFQEFADFMNRFPATDAVIEGHASAPGDADYNMMLSQKRADSVRTLLINEYGISSTRLTSKGFGETQLLDTSNTAAANKVNRRITAKVSASKKVKVER
jgi:OOP family OmpA-OmpF porin